MVLLLETWGMLPFKTHSMVLLLETWGMLPLTPADAG